VIDKIAIKMKRSDDSAYVKRCMWLGLNERIKDEFNKKIKPYSDSYLFGDFYFYSDDVISREAYKRRINIITCEAINATYIFTGNKRQRVYYMSNGSLTNLHESGAQLWYTQTVSGAVLVFISPCSSVMTSFDENEIIIGNYKQPISITNRKIEKHINIFLKYRFYSGFNSSSSFSSYFFRMRLKVLDFRNRKYINNLMYKIAPLILAAGGIIATLYAAK
jgi:hypothetical protein